MATFEELMAALRKADAAGDTEGAARIAQMASKIKGASPVPQGAPAVPQDAPSPVLPQDPVTPGGFDQQIIGLMQPAGGPQVSAVSAPAPAPRVAPIMAGPIKTTMTPRVAPPVEDPLLAALRGDDVQANGLPKAAPGAPLPEDKSTALGDLKAGWLGLRNAGTAAAIWADQSGANLNRNFGQIADSNVAHIDARIAEFEQALAASTDEMERIMLQDGISRLRVERDGFAGIAADPDYLAESAKKSARADTLEGRIISERIPTLAQRAGQIAAIPSNPSADKLNASGTFGEGLGALAEDPIGVVRSVVLRSAPQMAPTMLATVGGGLVGGPGGAALASGMTGAGIEAFSSASQSMTDALAAAGVDVGDPAAVEAFLSENEKQIREFYRDGFKRGGIIGAFDAVSGGIATTIARRVTGQSLGSKLAGVGTGAAVEAATEGAGEAAAQLATKGAIQPGEVIAEVIGGAGMGAPATAGQIGAEVLKSRAATRADQPPPAIDQIAAAMQPPATAPAAPTVPRPEQAAPAVDAKAQAKAALEAFARATKGAAIPSGSEASRQFDRIVADAQRAGLTSDEIDAALSGKPQPADTLAKIRAAMSGQPAPAPPRREEPPADPLSQITAAMQPPAPDQAPKAPAPEQPAPQAATNQTQPQPSQGDAGRYEILDEIENGPDGQRVPTGRKVRYDRETGTVEPIGPDQTDAAAASGGTTPPAPVPNAAPRQKGQPERRFLTNEETLSIETDAKTFQYKSGGDESGVTDRLKGVTKFDPDRAGQAILFRTADGRLKVADGHQRTGLAKRAAEAGQEDVGGMAALIYDEADGYTPQDVMAIAALKNIGEGSGTALDAARILRDRKESIEDLGLPPKAALVRDADGLRRLSPTAFGMVANGKASERDGAVVGRVVQDQAVQADILALLTQINPPNAAQAEMIARDAATDTATETQDDLFGSEQVAQSLYLERAKILDGAVKELRKNKAAFNVLLKNGAKIEGAGNKLDQDANAAQVQQDAMVLEYIQRQATMKGPISDALTAAARAVKSGGSVADARRAFVADVIGANQVSGPAGQNGAGGSGTDTRAPEPEREPQAVDPDARDDNAADGDLFGGPVAALVPDPQAQILAAMTGRKPKEPEAKPAPQADTSRKHFVDAINAIVKPENRDGDVDFTSEKGSVFVNADGDRTRVTVQTFRKTKIRGEWATEERSKTYDFSDIRDDLTAEARAQIEAIIAADQAESAAPEAQPGAAPDTSNWLDTGSTGKTPEQIRAEAEAKVRADQSKMRKPGGNTGDAGPLFNPDQDLFDPPKEAPQTFGAVKDWADAVLSALKARIKRDGSAKVVVSRERVLQLTKPEQVDDGFRAAADGIEVRRNSRWEALGITEADALAERLGLPSRFEAVPPKEQPAALSQAERVEAEAKRQGVDLGDADYRVILSGLPDRATDEDIAAAVRDYAKYGALWAQMDSNARYDAVIKAKLAKLVRSGNDAHVWRIADSKWSDLTEAQRQALMFEIPEPGERQAESKPDAMSSGQAFPTTLEEITAKERRQRAGERLSFIYAEYRSQRFYLAAVAGNTDAAAARWRETFPGASIYVTDRADGTSINGDSAALEAAMPKPKSPTDKLADEIRARQAAVEAMQAERREILAHYAVDGDEAIDKADAFVDLAETPSGEALMNDLAAAKTFAEKKAVADAFVLRGGKNTGVEHLVVLTESGIPLAITSGHKSGVSFPVAVWRAGSHGEVAYSVHNHPSSNGFSGSDLAILAIWPKHTLAIIGHNGDRHEARARRDFDMVDDAALRDPMNRQAKLNVALTEARDAALWRINQHMLEKGEANAAGEARYLAATRPFFQLVLEEMGLIIYTDRAKWRAQFEAQGFNFEDFYGQVSGAVADRLGRAGFIIPEGGNTGGNRPADESPQAASPGADGAAGKPAADGAKGDGSGRVPAKPVGPAKTGNAALDGALDDIFGDEADVPSPGQRVERDSGNPDPADGMGGTDVPAAAGRDGRGGEGRTGPGGSPDGEQSAGGGLPGGDAPPVGSGSDPGLDSAERPARKPASGRKRGAGDGNRAGGLSPDAGRGADPAGDASGAAPGKLTPAQQLAAIRGIFKEDVIDFVVGPERRRTDSDAFRKWFGNSKVVDADGEPLVVYHATWADFDRFDRRKLGQNVSGATSKMAKTAKVGFWFNNRDLAADIAATTSVPVYLEIQNPKRTSLNALADDIEAAGSVRAYMKEMSEAGYDGLIVKDDEFGGQSYVAIDPNQVKSVFNQGTWDASSPYMLREDAANPIDPRKAEALESIFIGALDGVNVKAASDRDLFRSIILPLRDAGMTREEVAELTPYLESFLADLRAGRVNLDRDPIPAALDRLNAAVPGWTAMNGMLTNPDPERGGIIDQAILGKKWFVVLSGSTRSADGLDTVDQAVDWFIQNHAAPAKPKPAPRIIPGDRDNIDATLPLLLPEQRDDVFKIETRFAKPDGHGMMITNGTGTGKTFSGGGVIKRFVQMGKGDILIVAPSEAVIAGWTKALAALGVPVNQLRDTKDAGQAVTITTYANLRDNDALASRSFDLVVTDESQNLMSAQDGAVTGALQNLRAITHRPADLWRKSRMRHADEWDTYKAMRDGEAKTAVYRRLKSREEAEVARWAQEPRSKVLFLSATPFAYDKTVDYAEGYLFDYPKDGHVGRSRQSGQNLFMVQHFGYRIRYHKLTKPEAAVDSAVFEREFHEKLKRDGVLSGRSLQVDVDYDRKFVLAADGLGTQIDAVLKHVFEGRRNPDKAIADGYQTLEREISQKFNYLKRMQLLEAIKARAAIPDIEKHLALGRKVVVFHDYNVGGGFNPFSNIAPANDANAIAAAADLLAAFPDLNRMKFASYAAPVDALLSALGKRARAFNGTVPQKKRLQNLADFNTDGSGADVLVVQSDAGGAGISMHDITGTHQRVLINLGMPTKPTTTLQEEGRILRVGTQTNAPFRYYTIGTAWERRAFATRIAERSGTVENLALGNEARDLLTGFIEAYEEAEAIEPGPDDGKGGKERDRKANVTSPFEKAKTHYFGRTKTTGRRDQRDGIDFYPTPEPLALKMVEWAGIRPNERVLEPSAGDGAIARYVPDFADLTMVEPSSDLSSRALLKAPHGKTVESTFESYHLVNKAHVIVMNPPFGSGGATAMQHLAKAAKHLRAGGRIVALIPTGPSADKRFDAWWEGDDAKGLSLSAEVALPAVAFERAGTSVMTRLVIIDKPAEGQEVAPDTQRLNFAGARSINEFFDRLEQYDVRRRPDPVQDAIADMEAEGQDATAPMPQPVQGPPLAAKADAFKLAQVKHAKTGADLFVATIRDKVEREEYTAILAVAKQHGGYYSSFRGNGAVPGFQFKSEAARQAFLDDMAKPTVGFAEEGAPLRTDTPAFEAWFGNSKVVDADGRPLVVYHGTASDFDAFDPSRIGSNFGDDTKGFFFTNNPGPDMASGYATMEGQRQGGNVIPAYVSIQRPYTFRDYAWQQGWSEKDLAKRSDAEIAREELDGRGVVAWWDRNKRGIMDDIIRDGHDGVILIDPDSRVRGEPESLVVAFSPTQIKSIFNRGTWDARDPRIQYQVTPPQMVREAAASTEEIRRLMPRLRAELDRLGLKRVRLVADSDARDWQGMFHVTGDGTLEIVIGASMDPMGTLHHEVIHALRAMNLFTPEEWRALELAAERVWIRKHDIEARYPDLTRAEQIEEAIAEEFSEALAARRSPKGSALVTAFNKIARLFRALRNVLNGAGYQTAEDIFGRILAGEISKRQAGNTGMRASFQRRKAPEGQGDLFAPSARPATAGMTADQRRELDARQQQSKMRKTGGNSGDAGPLFGTQKDLFGEGGPKFQRPKTIRPLTPQARAHRNSGMGGSLFIPDRRVWEELTRATAPIWARLRNGAGGMSDGIDRARVYIQDRFLPVLRAQEAIERATGKRLPPEQRAYTAETTFSGKVGRHLFEVDEDFVKPIIRLIAASKGRLTAEAVGEWLYARHAIERNAKIASINPAMPDGGSGMTNAEAQQILADAAASPDAARLVEIGSLIDKLRERTLSLREDAGLITHDEASDWRRMYRHYVPLKGFAETDHAEAVLDITGIGKRFNVRGGESRRALGRKSEAFNPLQAAFTQAQEVAIRAEKNRVGQSLHELAKDYPSKALWEVKKPAQKRYFNRSTGLVETRVEDPVSMILAPNEMAVKISGEEHRIIFHDERLARAAGTVGADQMGQITRLLSMFSRFWSMTRTMLNPEFAVANAFRDFQTAQFNIQAFGEGDKGAIAKAMLRDWRKALAGSWRAQGNRYDSVWAKHYREFQKAGAQVSFWTIEQPETAKEDLDRRVRLASGTMAARALKRLTSPRAILSMRDNPALAMIERANIAVDNAIRLAAFVEARKRGWSVEDAAFLAKELTVNFNRRGEVGANMNALYPFFNAAVQGSVRTVKALTSRRVALMAVTSIAAGMLNDLLNAWLSDEDDDGQLFYDKVPEYRNERNFHIVGWGTGQNPAAVPMPYGYNIFPYAGQNLGKVVRGVKSPSEAMGDVAAALFNAFSPVNGGSGTTLVSPFFTDPLIEMGENADWTGTPIYPRYPAVGAPDSEVYFSGASEASKAIASFLNSATGGDFREAGWISVSPETIDHLSAFVTGSAGAFAGRTSDVLAKALKGDVADIGMRDIPFLRTLTSPVGPWIDRDQFYSAKAAVQDANADVNAYAGAGQVIPPDRQALADLYDDMLTAEREMNGKGVWNQGKPGAVAPRADDVVMKEFNRKYLVAIGKVKP